MAASAAAASSSSAAAAAASSSGDGYKHDRRCIIYPSYINSACTVQQGRRIPKDAACEAPNVLEIRDVLEKSMKLPCEVEDKSYPRDFWQRGRVRVTIKKDDGSPIAKEFPTRRAGAVYSHDTFSRNLRHDRGAAAASKTMPTPLEILTQFTSQAGQAGASGTGGGGGGGGTGGGGGGGAGSSKKSGKKGKKGR